MNRRCYGALGALAVAALTLTACSSAGTGPSYQELGTSIDSGAHGKVTLVNDFTSIKVANSSNDKADQIAGASNRSGAGSNTTADLEVSANYTRGNWTIEGSWRDGIVTFNFRGWAEASQLREEYYGPLQRCSGDGSCQPESRSTPHGAPEPKRSEWLKGGCILFPSYYTSTNRTYPGTGLVSVTLCEVGTGSEIGGGAWAGHDFIQFIIPNTTVNRLMHDASPFRLYVGGGTLKNSALSVRTKSDWTLPTATPTPPWITPTPG